MATKKPNVKSRRSANRQTRLTTTSAKVCAPTTDNSKVKPPASKRVKAIEHSERLLASLTILASAFLKKAAQANKRRIRPDRLYTGIKDLAENPIFLNYVRTILPKEVPNIERRLNKKKDTWDDKDIAFAQDRYAIRLVHIAREVNPSRGRPKKTLVGLIGSRMDSKDAIRARKAQEKWESDAAAEKLIDTYLAKQGAAKVGFSTLVLYGRFLPHNPNSAQLAKPNLSMAIKDIFERHGEPLTSQRLDVERKRFRRIKQQKSVSFPRHS